MKKKLYNSQVPTDVLFQHHFLRLTNENIGLVFTVIRINYLFGDTETGSSIFSCLIEDAVMSTTSSVDPEVRGALIG